MRDVSMFEIARKIAEQRRLSLSELKGPTRERRVARPRQQAMAEMLDAGFSTTQVGRFLGDRDHTTVMYGARKHRERAQVSS